VSCLSRDEARQERAGQRGTRARVQAFARGVLANWLVCIAVWQAGAAASLPGKALGAWFPVSAFVALGLEHSARPVAGAPRARARGSRGPERCWRPAGRSAACGCNAAGAPT